MGESKRRVVSLFSSSYTPINAFVQGKDDTDGY
jgi:hypothetical protein